MSDHNTVMHLYSGRTFDLGDIEHQTFDSRDIAHGLSMLCRYSGQTDLFYSVAQHSLLVSEYVPTDDALWGLLHDASEAYLVDLPRPVKYLEVMKPYRDLEARVQAAICDQFGLPHEEPASVAKADHCIVHDEMRSFGLAPASEFHLPIYPLSSVEAARMFNFRLDDLLRRRKQ